MKRKATLVLLCMMMMHATAHAFDVHGVRSGMAYDEVVAKLQQPGVTLKWYQEQAFTRLVRFREEDTDLWDFCDGKLVGYAYNTVGDIRTFIRIVEQMTRQRGAGQYKAEFEDWRLGPHHALSFSWVDGPDTITVFYTPDFPQAKSYITTSYTVTEAKCLKDKPK